MLRVPRSAWVLAASATLVVAAPSTGGAQPAPLTPPADTAVFPHPDDTWWWLSGQLNLILQTHGRFTSPYEGPNSLRSDAERAVSRVWTIYTGITLPRHTELLLDIESAGGAGLSD